MSKPLLEKRIGGRAGYEPAPKHAKASWPLGKLTLYKDRLVIRLFLLTFEIPYSQITTIKRGWYFNVLIQHDEDSEPEYISLIGLGLLNDIKRTNRRHRLGLRVR